MAPRQNDRIHKEAQHVREIPKWACRYAKHHSIPILVSFGFAMLFCTGVTSSAYLMALAYRARKMVWFWTCTVVFVSIWAALIWYMICGGKLVLSLSKRFYRKEGSAALDTSMTKKPVWVYGAVISVFGGCIGANVLLGYFGALPLKYMQPASAIYWVPFAVFISLVNKREVRLLLLLWPILYGLHAILIVAGVPLPLSQARFGLSIWIPALGYGMVVTFACHLYSRFALRRLKKLAKVPPEAVTGEGEQAE